MQDSQCCVRTNASKARAFVFTCGWESIRQLRSGRLDGDVIDTILGLGYSTRSGSVYLGTDICKQITKRVFRKSKDWVEHISRDEQWLFRVCEEDHWVAAGQLVTGQLAERAQRKLEIQSCIEKSELQRYERW